MSDEKALEDKMARLITEVGEHGMSENAMSLARELVTELYAFRRDTVRNGREALESMFNTTKNPNEIALLYAKVSAYKAFEDLTFPFGVEIAARQMVWSMGTALTGAKSMREAVPQLIEKMTADLRNRPKNGMVITSSDEKDLIRLYRQKKKEERDAKSKPQTPTKGGPYS